MVHDLNDVRFARMKNWLTIQKNIGIDRVKFYFAQNYNHFKDILNKEFNEYVEIVDYRLDFDFICQFHIELKRNNKYSPIFDMLLNNCKTFYNIFFNTSITSMRNAHEKLCTNDCLLNFKYEYEFTTNYDFDEFIFPRKFPSNNYTYFNSQSTNDCKNSLTQFSFNYSMYEYAMRLTQTYGPNVGFFHFENVMFLTVPENVWFIEKLLSPVQERIKLRVSSGNEATFKISPRNFKQIDEIFQLQMLVECLNVTITEKNRFDSIWNVPYAILINYRWGKSLYNTNLTITYNQHHSDYLESSGRRVFVSIDDGYVAHFRENFGSFLNGECYSFSYFRFDLEYYQFLAYLNTIAKF